MRQAELFDADEGRRRKDEGKAHAASNPRRQLIKERARVIAVEAALRHPLREVSADDVYRQLIAEGYNHKELGNAAGSLFSADRWEMAGRKKSVRISNHSRWIFVWRLKQ